jgi:hypothetical protein
MFSPMISAPKFQAPLHRFASLICLRVVTEILDNAVWFLPGLSGTVFNAMDTRDHQAEMRRLRAGDVGTREGPQARGIVISHHISL